MGPPTPAFHSLLRLSAASNQLFVSSPGLSTHSALRQLLRSQYPHQLFVSFSGRSTHNGSISPHRLSAANVRLSAAPIRFPVTSLRLSAAHTGSSSLYPALSGPPWLPVASFP
ncbi:hypothetical protein CF319_g7954 [Tilletia indica]|nr:hypothetical protein CF319_g7954 [Tilletia indica]